MVATPQLTSLAARNCAPLPAGMEPLAEPGARELLKRVVGWKLVPEPSGLRLRGEWRVRDEESGGELMRRMGAVVEGQQEQCGGGQQADMSVQQGYVRMGAVVEAQQEQCGGAQQADMSVQQGYVVRVDLHTPAMGGLSENDIIIAAKRDLMENDFIIAAKMDLVKVSDLIKKARFWA
ncbi:unnamed protein product [Closterium sp. Naga37s-1]|nr:unnamed protein product [Closterium sp. Naga37s-1]